MLPLTSQHVLGALGTGVTKSFAVGSFPGVGGAVWGGGGSGEQSVPGHTGHCGICLHMDKVGSLGAAVSVPHAGEAHTAHLVTCQRVVGGQPPSLQSANEENGVLLGSIGDDLGSVGCTWATGSKVVMADKDDVSESGEGHGQLVGLPVKGHAPCWLGGPPCGSHTCTFHACFVALSLLASLL